MEEKISLAIVERFFEKLREHLAIDVAVVGAGPSGMVAARDLAAAGKKVAVFERKLAPGGGIWGGGMLFNEVVVQEDSLPILEDFGIGSRLCGEGRYTVDAVEMAAGLVFGACRAGAVFFNAVSVEDIVFKEDRVAGVVINWSPVTRLEMHVDPLVVTSRAVLDGTGHPSEIAALASRKAGIALATGSGGIMGERPMWVERGEESTVRDTKQLCPGLYVSGMAANNVSGGFRMGPIFGGMLKSGRKAAALILEEFSASEGVPGDD
ncbi:MAG: sulfide-dependent adenosine diphosphate thiazole synthase [Candidatus Erginobacter occultus]|nr:sulfide-dependent adenosine diphosphate thiazole synthase [Candidatus Erginobacter occultus]